MEDRALLVIENLQVLSAADEDMGGGVFLLGVGLRTDLFKKHVILLITRIIIAQILPLPVCSCSTGLLLRAVHIQVFNSSSSYLD